LKSKQIFYKEKPKIAYIKGV